MAGNAAPAPGETSQVQSATPPAAQPNGSAPPPAQPPAPVAQQPAPAQGTPALVLDVAEYEGLLGKSVRAMNGDDLGRIIDVIVDKEGRPRAAIIDFGGFLGVGSRKIAVDWRVLKFATPDGKTGPVTLQLSRNQVRVSPEYKAGDPIVVLGATSPGGPVPEGEQAAAPVAPAQPAPPQAAPSALPAAPEKPADRPAEKQPEKTPE